MYFVMITCCVVTEDGITVHVRRPAMLPMPPYQGMELRGLLGYGSDSDPHECSISSVTIDMENGIIVADLDLDDYSEYTDLDDPYYTYDRLFNQPGMCYHGWEHFEYIYDVPFGNDFVRGELILRPGNLPALKLRRNPSFGPLQHYGTNALAET